MAGSRRLRSRWKRRWAGIGASFFLAIGGPAALHGQVPTPAPVCRAVQLEPFSEGEDCGSGRCYTQIQLRNVSPAACTLPARTTVTALDAQGGVMRHEKVMADAPLMLPPGAFGEYQSESYSGAVFPHAPPAAARYRFRFATDDKSYLVVPGDQRIASGPETVFDSDHPAPDLSRVPQLSSGVFAFSAFVWPPAAHSHEDGDANLLEDSSLGSLHVSVANHGTTGSAGWDNCRIVIDAAEDGASQQPEHSVYPCAWNGAIAHGAIAADATVAQEAEAKLPKVCHRAHYTVTVSLENAPAHFAPMTLHTEELQPLCSDSRESAVAVSSVPPPVVPAEFKSRGVQWGLPVGAIRLGLEIPIRRYLYEVLAIDDPGDPVWISVWVDNGRDTPIHLAGPHGFHLRVLNATPPHGATEFDRPLEMDPRSGSNETGPIDIVVPPHTILRVANLNLGAEYDFSMGPVPRQEFLIGVSPDALTGADARWNWVNDQKNVWSLKALASFRVEPHGVSR